MTYRTTSNNGRYSAQFRNDAKTENKNGQSIVSHTSLLEPGRDAAVTRAIADLYEDVMTADDPCPNSRINRDCTDR